MTHQRLPPTETEAAISNAETVQQAAERGPAAEQSVAVSLALQSALANPEVTSRVAQFFDGQNVVAERQAALLDRRIERAQAEKEQIEAQTRHVEMQDRHLRMEHIHDRLRLVLDVGLAALGVALLTGIGWAIYGAVTDRSIVVNAFTVPPRLEAEGRSGAAVAGLFLDELRRLRGATHSANEQRAVTDSLAQQVQVEIPDLHVSFGEALRVLHETLGHRVQIRGSLVETADGLALTLRGTALPARTVEAKAADLPGLVTRAAEYAYGSADPTAMAYYLERSGRLDEALAFIKSAFAAAPVAEQAILLNVWANVVSDDGRYDEAIAKYRAAIDLNPRYWIPRSNLTGFLQSAQREEEGMRAGEEFEQAAHRGRWSEASDAAMMFTNVDLLRWDLPAVIHGYKLDLESTGGHGTTVVEVGPAAAEVYALQHDATAALLLLETSPGADVDEYSLIQGAKVRGIVAFDVGEYGTAARHWRDWRERLTHTSSVTVKYGFPGVDCWLPIVFELAGEPTEADAAIAATAQEKLVDCYRFRGDVHAHRGAWDLAAADYAAGVALAPSLPPVYLNWGKALLARKDYTAAIDKFAAAHQRGPHWADPLEYWGEALAAQGAFKDAAAKYAEAAPYAPKWGALHLHYGAALEGLGDQPKARAEFRVASGLALSAMDRTIVNARLRATTN